MMKQISTIALTLIGLTLGIESAAQESLKPFSQPVRTIKVIGSSKLNIRSNQQTGIEQKDLNRNPSIKIADGVASINTWEKEVTLYLNPSDINHFVADEQSTVTFKGSFSWPDSLVVESVIAAKVKFEGDNNTIASPYIKLSTDDFANITVDGTLEMEEYNYSSEGLSSLIINTSRLRTIKSEPKGGATSNDELSTLNIDHMINATGDTTSYQNPDVENFDKFTTAMNEVMRAIPFTNKWRSNTDFALGFHNWGPEPYNGLAGMANDAAIRTSMNHLQLTFNYPMLKGRYAALYLGIGLDWNKYKFDAPYVEWEQGADGVSHFTAVATESTNYHTQLLTRYVVMPITARFRLGNSNWKLEFSAIPGLHWSGSHTGFRRQLSTSEAKIKDKDYSINSQINPYMLDARIVLRYRTLGFYLQVPTLPTMRNEWEKLYPIKFGLIL